MSKVIGTVVHPFTGDEVDVLDRRGLFRCRHRFLFRMMKADEGSGGLMAAGKRSSAHLAKCQVGLIFGWRTDIGVRAGL